jgi:hypothetical protein
MTQQEFNQGVLEVLWKLATKVGEGRYSEPKHGVVGDEIGDMINALENEQPCEDRT